MPGKSPFIFLFFLSFLACKQDFPEPFVSLDEFQLEQGFRIECVAAEPMVEVPVAMVFDEQNRMWVAEMSGFMPNADASGEDAPVGKIVILEDVDGDGAVDHRKIFLDSLVLPRALAFAGNGLLYCEPPNLWFVEIDHDSPGKRTLVDSLYAPGANPEYQANGLLRGIDNWYYSANSSRRYRLRYGIWESETTHFRGQWGMTQDANGRLFYNYNSNQLVGDYLLPGVLERNASHKPRFGLGKKICTDQRVYPARSTIVNRGYQKGELDENGRLVNFTSACGPHIYLGDGFPPEYYGNAFVCAPEAYLIKRNIFDPSDGVTLTAHQAYKGREFLASTDETFRPVTLLTGLDGCLYVLDMRKGIIQHRAYMSSYLHEQSLKNGLDTIIGKGRIYRICAAENRERQSIRFAGKNDRELVRLLAHGNGAVRMKAQQILVDRQAKGIAVELRKRVFLAATFPEILHDLWTLEGLDELDDEVLLEALQNADETVTATALKILSGYKPKNPANFSTPLEQLRSSRDRLVRIYVAAALGNEKLLPSKNGFQLLASLIRENPGDTLLVEASLSGLAGREEFFLNFLATSGQSPLTITQMLETAIAQKRYLEEHPPTPGNNNDNRTAGWQLFQLYCSVCHQSNGQGMPSLAPSLVGSKVVNGPKEKMMQVIWEGKHDPIIVNGQVLTFNNPMPVFKDNPAWTKDMVGEVIAFVKNAFAEVK